MLTAKVCAHDGVKFSCSGTVANFWSRDDIRVYTFGGSPEAVVGRGKCVVGRGKWLTLGGKGTGAVA